MTANPSAAAELETPGQVSQELRGQAIDVLRQTLERESRWVKVHAADFLLMLDYPQGVAEVFARELDEFGDLPEYRIGIWRVLARAALQEKQRSDWIAKIRDVFLDENALDRSHAAETLGKLGYTTREKGDELFDLAPSNNDSLSVFVQWVLANSKREGATARLAEFLSSDDATVRLCAAYALQLLPKVSPEVGEELVAATQSEPADSPVRAYLVASATVHAPEESRSSLKDQLLAYFDTGTDDEKYEACIALARIGTNDDLPLLASLLKHTNADVRSGAAYAILRIDRRQPHNMTALDWTMIALYAVGMLAVGWYYARRTANTEDYLLGGRKMNPLSVGLSLFATLLSTLSYLSIPGEMIQHGPALLLGTLVPLPLVIWVVGWFMIPHLMKL